MSKISTFLGAQAPQVTGETTVNDWLQEVAGGTWRAQIEALNAAPADQREALKKKLPSVTMSGLFSYRNEQSLLEHSGFICFDFDKLNEETAAKRALLEADPHTYAVGFSSSRKGLFCLVKIDGTRHLDAWRALDAYYLQKYGLIADPKAKDVPRLRFATYDETLFVNPKAVTFKSYLPKKEVTVQARQSAPVIYTGRDIDSVITSIVDRGLDITNSDYERFYKIGFALIEEFGPQGRERYHMLCRNSAKYDPDVCDRQFDYCSRSPRQAGGNKVGIGTLFFYAKEAGIQTTSKETQQIATIARQTKKSGSDEASAKKRVAVAVGDAGDAADIDKVIAQVFAAPDGVNVGDESDLISQLEVFLTTNYELKRNDITKAIEHRGVELSTADYNSIYIAAKKQVSEKVTQADLLALINSEYTETYNPILLFFENNRGLEAEGKIEALAASITTDTGLKGTEAPDTGFVEHFLRKWLVGLVASAHGQHSPLLFALVGGINTGKTEFFRRLLPKDLQRFYGESKLDAGKDDELLMTQKLIILDDELGGKSKRDDKRLKELTSKQVFSLREPYGKKNSDFRRLAMLAGTSNDRDLLTDPTGNRRIIPVNVLSINHDQYNAVDKKLLLIEAYNLWRAGYEYHLSNDDVKRLNISTGEFEAAVSERELLLQFFKIPEPGAFGVEHMSTSAILAHLQNVSNIRLSLKALGSQLQSLGFDRPAVKLQGRTVRLYRVIKQGVALVSPRGELPGAAPAPAPPAPAAGPPKPVDDLPF